MRFLICADIITGLCLLALAAAVVANFAANRRTHAFDERRSPVATATMTAFGVLVYATIRFRWGGLPLVQPSPEILGLRVAGLLLLAGGTAFNIWGRRHLKHNWADHVRIYDNQSLVTDGPYRIVRHPLYASLIWMIYGASLAYLSPLAALENALVFYPMMLYRARLEEAALAGTFGDAYRRYSQQTGRFLPRLFKRATRRGDGEGRWDAR